MKRLLIPTVLLIGVLRSLALEWPEGQITFQVKDESGKTLSSVPIETVVFDPSKPATYKVVSASTDTHGVAVVNTLNVTAEYSYTVRNFPGYYSSGGVYTFKSLADGKWQPWNPTVDIVLKPIGVRVPMYAKKVDWNTSLPENNKAIGYDLELGDWVAPYGKGITADFLFTLERKFASVTQDFNATLTLTFPNDGDGIQSVMSDSSGSALRIPRSAPTNNYESKLVLQMYRETNKPIVGATPDPNQNYFFRVRTKKDDRGNIVSALYGKIKGSVGWDIFHSPTAQIQFDYYLNSKLNSRVMEFDPQQNLFKKLPPLERVTAP